MSREGTKGLKKLVYAGVVTLALVGGVREAKGSGIFEDIGKPIPNWFTEQTGFGLFLHWGPWSAKYNSTCGWSLFRGTQTCEEFAEDLGPKFAPDKYDPDKWMKAALEAGFTYAVLTTRHHDGYELWPTEIDDDWGTKGYMKGRDLIKPYVEACRNNGIRVGFYFSPTDWMWNHESWPYPGYPYKAKDFLFNDNNKGFVDEPREKMQKNLDNLFYKNIYPAVEELMTRYGRIDILWFDGWNWGWPRSRVGLNIHPYEMEKMVRSHQPDILINPRYDRGWGGKRKIGQFLTEEVGFPKKRPESYWELCRSIRGGWGACRPGAPRSGRPTVRVLVTLAKCRSWGGNFLANIGPFPDGTMPAYFYSLCADLKEWMTHSKESLLNVEGGPWPQQCNVPVTTRGNTWYLFGWPQNDKLELDEACGDEKYQYFPRDKTLIVKDVERPKEVVFLRTQDKMKFDHEDRTLTIVIPAQSTTMLVDVVKVDWRQ